mgnify:CR=1 FL=1
MCIISVHFPHSGGGYYCGRVKPPKNAEERVMKEDFGHCCFMERVRTREGDPFGARGDLCTGSSGADGHLQCLITSPLGVLCI